MKSINNMLYEKLDLSKTTNNFRDRYIAKSSATNTKKFKDFFRNMSELSGLKVNVYSISSSNNYSMIGRSNGFYKIRSEEPDESIYSNTTGNANSWKGVYNELFSPNAKDIRTDDILCDPKTSNNFYILTLGNLDDTDCKDLLKIGFKDLNNYRKEYTTNDFYNSNTYNQYLSACRNLLQEAKLNVFIVFADLYKNIDKIYKEFFE